MARCGSERQCPVWQELDRQGVAWETDTPTPIGKKLAPPYGNATGPAVAPVASAVVSMGLTCITSPIPRATGPALIT